MAWLSDHGLTETGSVRASTADLENAIRLREALRSILLAHVDCEPVPADAAMELDVVACRSRLRLRFDRDGGAALEPQARGVDGALGRLLAIVHRAIEAGSWERLKACRQEVARGRSTTAPRTDRARGAAWRCAATGPRPAPTASGAPPHQRIEVLACKDEVVPTFCRHNRLIQTCPICSREQEIELRPVVSSSAPRTGQPRARSSSSTRSRASSAQSGPRGGVTVRRLARGAEDGYSSPLAPGLRSSADAERLAEELAFAAGRLARLEQDPPGLYADVADEREDIEDRTWLAFLIAYLGPTQSDDPFAAIRHVATPWTEAQPPELDRVELGPRPRTTRRAARARSRPTARGPRGRLTGGRIHRRRRMDSGASVLPDGTPGVPGLTRARFDLLVTLGRLGVYDLRAGALELKGSNNVTVAAKRALGIGDPLLLERRAAELARECGLPLEALDLGLSNWERGQPATLGLPPDTEPDPDALTATRAALGL